MLEKDYEAMTVLQFGTQVNEGLSDDEVKSVYDDLSQRHLRTQANIEVVIDIYDIGRRRGIVESWGRSYVRLLFDTGERAFISTGDADGVRLLFKESYFDTGIPSRYKYPIDNCEMNIKWLETPTCPVTGEDMTYGTTEYSPVDGHDGFMSGWLTASEIPARVEEGMR